MKKVILALLMTIGLQADYYTDYVDSLMGTYTDDFSTYNAVLLDTSASMVAMSNIDFVLHDGLSLGVGFATIHTDYGIGNAYAVGMQYGYEEFAFTIKGAYKGDSEYIIGSGLVVGF